MLNKTMIIYEDNDMETDGCLASDVADRLKEALNMPLEGVQLTWDNIPKTMSKALIGKRYKM